MGHRSNVDRALSAFSKRFRDALRPFRGNRDCVVEHPPWPALQVGHRQVNPVFHGNSNCPEPGKGGGLYTRRPAWETKIAPAGLPIFVPYATEVRSGRRGGAS